MKHSAIAKRYAKALLGFGDSSHQTDEIIRKLDLFREANDTCDDLREVLSNPALLSKREAVVEAVARELAIIGPSLKALTYLVKSDRIRILPDILQAMREILDGRSGRVRAEIVTTHKMPEDRYLRIRAALERITGKKIEIEKKTDPELIGGFVARVGSVVFDGSIRSQLSQAKAALGKES